MRIYYTQESNCILTFNRESWLISSTNELVQRVRMYSQHSDNACASIDMFVFNTDSEHIPS